MLFTIQAYLEDYLNKRRITDPDAYAVRVANLYYHHRATMETDAFARRMKRIRTLLFVNSAIKRAEFELELLARLDKRFKKKLDLGNPSFPGGTFREGKRLRRLPRLTIEALVNEFKHAVEARAIDTFWESRKSGKLRRRPEKIAQGLFATFAKGSLRAKGLVLREVVSGIGFVDLGIVISKGMHLVELKILTGKFVGPSQLAHYMALERRSRGHLLVIDALEAGKKTNLPDSVRVAQGVIRICQIDINPTAPSRAKPS
jgi:hypothetical protein